MRKRNSMQTLFLGCLMISFNECNRVSKETYRGTLRTGTTQSQEQGKGRWGLDMVSSWESNIHSNPQRAQDFNESGDLRFEDSYGNSAGAPFQQCIPSWTHAVPEKPRWRQENVWERRLQCFSNWIKKDVQRTQGRKMFGTLATAFKSSMRCLQRHNEVALQMTKYMSQYSL